MAFDVILGRTARDWSCGASSDSGSILFPVKEQKRLYDKIDDVRFDIRGAKNTIGAGVFAAAGALALLGIASIYRGRKT